MVLQKMSQHSTNQLHAFSFRVGRAVLLNKDYCLNTSSSSKIADKVGTLGIYSILITNQQQLLCGYHKILLYSKRSKPFRGS